MKSLTLHRHNGNTIPTSTRVPLPFFPVYIITSYSLYCCLGNKFVEEALISRAVSNVEEASYVCRNNSMSPERASTEKRIIPYMVCWVVELRTIIP